MMSSEVEKVKREVPELALLSFMMSSEVEKVSPFMVNTEMSRLGESYCSS